MKFTAKFLSLLTICFIANNITHIHATLLKEKRKQSYKLWDEQKFNESKNLDKEIEEETKKICDQTKEKFYTLLKEDTTSEVVLICIGAYISLEENYKEDKEYQEWKLQQQPYFFMQAAKNYPKNKFTIIEIDPIFIEESYDIQTEIRKNLTIIKVPMPIFASYEKCASTGEDSENEKQIFDNDIDAFKKYIQGIFNRKGAVIIADLAHAIHKPIVDELSKIMTLTGELYAEDPIDIKDMKPYMTFASTDARFYCYDLFNLDDELDDENTVDTGGIVNILRIIKTKDEQFKIFDPRYANLVGDVEWHNKK